MLNLFIKFINYIHKQNLSSFYKKETVKFFDFYAKCMLSIALLSRVSFAALAIIISLKTENGFLVSPFVEVQSGDYGFYFCGGDIQPPCEQVLSKEIFSWLWEPFLFLPWWFSRQFFSKTFDSRSFISTPFRYF